MIRSHPKIVEKPHVVLRVLRYPGPESSYPGLLVLHPEGAGTAPDHEREHGERDRVSRDRIGEIRVKCRQIESVLNWSWHEKDVDMFKVSDKKRII